MFEKYGDCSSICFRCPCERLNRGMDGSGEYCVKRYRNPYSVLGEPSKEACEMCRKTAGVERIDGCPCLILKPKLAVKRGRRYIEKYEKEKGVIFAFVEEDWPAPACQPIFMKILWYALVFMGIVVVMILPFILPLIF